MPWEVAQRLTGGSRYYSIFEGPIEAVQSQKHS
jgi:hypothetical protein